MNILLVEPDKVLADICSAELVRAGHEVDSISGAQAAILAADKKAPDIVLLELNLPAHNGVEFLYEFRSYPEWQSIPIIIYSFKRRDNLLVDEGLWRHLGITEYLYKPNTSLRQLVEAVRRHIPVSA